MADNQKFKEMQEQIDVLMLKLDQLSQEIDKMKGIYDVDGVNLDGTPDFVREYERKLKGNN
jgi:uncharacterized coiled-coil DUF342 family protein